MNKIRAQVMYEWNRNVNKGCKFIPGDLVVIFKTCSATAERELKHIEQSDVGEVIAVTTDNGKTIRSYSRMYTKYYVRFGNGEVIGVLSGNLRKARSIGPIPTPWLTPTHAELERYSLEKKIEKLTAENKRLKHLIGLIKSAVTY